MRFIRSWSQWMTIDMREAIGSVGLLILRVGVGLMMLSHGWGKLSNFSQMSGKFPNPLGIGSTLSLSLATFAEFGCSILIILGLATRLAAIPLIITMGVAGFIIHAEDLFDVKEKAFLYLVVFIGLVFTGAGRYSIDAILVRRSTKTLV